MNRKIIEQDLENIYCRNIPWEDLQSKTVLISGAYGMLASYFIYMLIYLNERYQMDIKILALIRSEKNFSIASKNMSIDHISFTIPVL